VKLFYSCNVLEDDSFELSGEFSVTQNELELISSKAFKNKEGLTDYRHRYQKIEVVYKCQWHQQENWSSDKPTLLIPIRNNKELIEYTIDNLNNTVASNLCNTIIIDDRSTEDIRTSALDNNLSYLRVDNERGFNFSMLNNIAAKVCDILGSSTIILWNSDLWCPKEGWLTELLKRHKASKAWVSGTKLVYPPEEMSLGQELDTKNIEEHFPDKTSGVWRETIQFGGSYWHPVPIQNATLPPVYWVAAHHRRFTQKSDPIANCDKPTDFVTGAFHIWELDKFIQLGGLNPCMAKVFQDTDLCLKALKAGHPPMYFGKNIYLYHDESYNHHHNGSEKKLDKQFFSDQIIFGKYWNEQILSLIVGPQPGNHCE